MSNRAAWIVAVFLLLGGLWACWSDLTMIWDGAYQFCYSLIQQRAYFHVARFHSWVVWQPMMWLSTVSQDLGLLRFVYGLPFCMAPLIGFVVSWWVARRHAPHLILWAAFGTATAMLPGQVFIINDSIFQLHLFWPVFLGMMLPLSGIQKAVLAALAVFQLSHPIGMVLCGGAALAIGWLAYESQGERRNSFFWRAGIMASLAGAGFLKLFLFPDKYAASEFTLGAAWSCWMQGVMGWPLLGWICMAAAARALYLMNDADPALRRKYQQITLGCVAGGALIWLFWASTPERWGKALDYRRFVVPLSAPFLAFAWMELRARREMGAMEIGLLRSSVACVLGALFLGVMGLHSTQWQTLHTRLFKELEESPEVVVDPASLPWIKRTALEHWSSTALPVAHGITNKLLVETEHVAPLHAAPPRVPLSFFASFPPEPGRGGWFDFREAVARLEGRESPTPDR